MKKTVNILMLSAITLSVLSPLRNVMAETIGNDDSEANAQTVLSKADSQPSTISVHDSTIYAGSGWAPKDNFNDAIVNGDTHLDYNQFIASDGTVDTSQVKLETPGVYPVTYSLNSVTSTAYITISEDHLVVKGDNLKRYVGDPIPEDSEFNAVGNDYSGASLPVAIDKSRIDMSKAGTYAVFLSITSLERPNFTFTTAVTVNVMDKQTTIKAHDSTIYVGDKWNAQDNFDSALDKDGNAVDFSQVEVDASQVDTTKPGIYNVSYTYEGVTTTAKVTVKAKQTTIKAHDSTIYVGDKWNAQDNFDSALDKDGNSVDFSQVEVDASQVDTTKPGIYNVTYTYEGVTTTAKVTVKAKQTTIKAHDSTIYVGDKWNAQDNFDSALDKDGNAVDFSQVEVDASQVDTTKPGIYNVTYTYEGVTTTAKVTVKAKQTTIKAHDSTIYVGDKWNAQDNFDSALDKDGNAVGFSQVEVDASQVDTTKPGIYNVTYTYEGVTTTAKITVKAKQIMDPTKPTNSINRGNNKQIVSSHRPYDSDKTNNAKNYYKSKQIVSSHRPYDSDKTNNTKNYYKKNKEEKYNLNKNQLPKTGEKNSVLLSVVGILTLVLFSITLLFKNKVLKK